MSLHSAIYSSFTAGPMSRLFRAMLTICNWRSIPGLHRILQPRRNSRRRPRSKTVCDSCGDPRRDRVGPAEGCLKGGGGGESECQHERVACVSNVQTRRSKRMACVSCVACVSSVQARRSKRCGTCTTAAAGATCRHHGPFPARKGRFSV